MDEVMAVFIALVQFSVSLPLPWIRNVAVRKLYATVCGMCIGFYCYGVEFWILIAYIMLAWCIQRFLPW